MKKFEMPKMDITTFAFETVATSATDVSAVTAVNDALNNVDGTATKNVTTMSYNDIHFQF